MKGFLLALALFPTLVFASPITDSICGEILSESAPAFSQSYSALTNRVMKNDEVILRVNDQVVSLIESEKSLWILTRSELIEANLAGEIQNEFSFGGRHNLTMSLTDSILLIARGKEGILAFDISKKETLWTRPSSNEEGRAVAVASEGKIGYAATQTNGEGQFTGIVSFDLMTGKILKRSPYHYAYGVIGIDVRASMYKGNLVLNNQGWIHLITPKQMNSGKMIKPRWVAHQIPRNGEVNPHYMMLVGDFRISGNELVGCGVYNEMDNGEIIRKGKKFQVKLP